MSDPRYDKVVGFSGHQALSEHTRELVRSVLTEELSGWTSVLAITCLAAGSDQIFAEVALELGNQLSVIVPCEDYESTFTNPADLARYRVLLKSSVDTIRLPFQAPSDEAYWAAGKRVVDTADLLFAVWDGLPAGGLGGTADVVHYATAKRKEVLRIWPNGASRR